jgi:hypothetical protein
VAHAAACDGWFGLAVQQFSAVLTQRLLFSCEHSPARPVTGLYACASWPFGSFFSAFRFGHLDFVLRICFEFRASDFGFGPLWLRPVAAL